MSEYRIEKRRHARATITFASGLEVSGNFFLAEATDTHAGPERVYDLLNRPGRFFPFEVDGGESMRPFVALYARAHVLTVKLDPASEAAELTPSFQLASDKIVSMLFTNGKRHRGALHVAMPEGMDRVSDFASLDERFQYLGSQGNLSLVNLDLVLEILPVSD